MCSSDLIRQHDKFICVTEMPVDILLFCIRAGSGLGRHKAVGRFIRVNVGVILIIGFEVTDQGIEVF